MSSPESTFPVLRIGVDTGGTFTDFITFLPSTGEVTSFKLPSTPHNPAEAVLQGLRRIHREHPGFSLDVVHGSTVATNALLERKGAVTALVTTRGFRDLLEIGRQNRPQLYDLFPAIPPPLVPEVRRFELPERVVASGEVLQALSSEDVRALVAELSKDRDLESVAVCFLFAFLHSDHEIQVANALREQGLFISLSSHILPEYREYERMSTTVVNAYVSPVFDRYLGDLNAGLHDLSPHATLRIMQSNGGVISTERARQEAVRCILSGPAGGVIACDHLQREDGVGRQGFLTIDMGGTSTDVCLIAGAPAVTTEADIAGHPVRIPLLDIHAIGAGGGSIASIDPGGGLNVGPESAGADPGPACYGLQEGFTPLPTVTDANLILGRLVPGRFLGGQMDLHPAEAERALVPLATRLGLSLQEAAAGIVGIANAHMARALRVISVERGHDPQDFTLVSFGGAGGLHAVDLAKELGMRRVVVPRYAATLSALGLIQADLLRDYSRTIMAADPVETGLLAEVLNELTNTARNDLRMEGVAEEDMTFESRLDIRYRGQSFDLTVPFSASWRTTFARLYKETYGYLPESDPLEVVNVRLQARGRVPDPQFPPMPTGAADPQPAFLGKHDIWHDGQSLSAMIFDGDELAPGNRLTGPALITRSDTTIWLPPGSQGTVDGFGNVIVCVEPD